MRDNFWQLPLNELATDEWEGLCDGCGKCCLHKLQDEYSNEIFYTRVACRYLDTEQCRCIEYERRKALVPDCVVINEGEEDQFYWFPKSCAYRLRSEDKPLPAWHYLVCGDKQEVHRVGASVVGRVISEDYVHPDDMPEQIVQWVEL